MICNGLKEIKPYKLDQVKEVEKEKVDPEGPVIREEEEDEPVLPDQNP